jgi:hypothetical protein
VDTLTAGSGKVQNFGNNCLGCLQYQEVFRQIKSTIFDGQKGLFELCRTAKITVVA